MTDQDEPKNQGPKDPAAQNEAPKDQAAAKPAAPGAQQKKSIEAQHKFGPQRGKFSNKQVQQRPAIFRGGPRGR